MTLKDRIIAATQQLTLVGQMRKVAQFSVQTPDLTDKQILEIALIYPEWKADTEYKENDVCRFDGNLYRCEQAHTSQASWTPDAAPSLWSQIDIADDGIDVWTQPTGAHNAYNKGDRVHYPKKDSPIYQSTIDGNVWSPDAYPQGWKLVEDAGEATDAE